MAWTAPMTAVAGTYFTASQFNTHIRDNLLETVPGIATGSGSFVSAAGANRIAARRFRSAYIATMETNSRSTAFTDLPTVGPRVTATTGRTAIVSFMVSQSHLASASESVWTSFEVTGATSIAPDVNSSVHHKGGGTGFTARGSYTEILVNLNPGSNTFTLKYGSFGGAGSWANRYLTVVPL